MKTKMVSTEQNRCGGKRIKIFMMFFAFFLFALTQSVQSSEQTGSPSLKAGVKKVLDAGILIDAIQTTEGNYVSIGSKMYSDGTVIIRKATAQGQRIWEKALSYKIPNGGYAFFRKIVQTNDGYVLVGAGRLTDYYYGPGGAIIVALDSNGSLRWNKGFELSEGNISFNSVTSRPDGTLIVIGETYPPASHGIVIKFSPGGSVLWAKALENISIISSQTVSGNGLVVLGGGNYGPVLVKMDDSGRILWNRTVRINDASASSNSGLKQPPIQFTQASGTSQNGIVIAGQPSSKTLVLVGLDENGKLQWKSKYFLNIPAFDVSSVRATLDGGHLITGTRNDEAGSLRGGYILKIDANQNLVLQKTFSSNALYQDLRSGFASKQGGYVLFGSFYGGSNESKNDLLFFSLNSDGVVPGCNSPHHLNARRVLAPKVTFGHPKITLKPFSLPPPMSIEWTSVASEKPSSNACP